MGPDLQMVSEHCLGLKMVQRKELKNKQSDKIYLGVWGFFNLFYIFIFISFLPEMAICLSIVDLDIPTG